MISVQVNPANQSVFATALHSTNQTRWATALALPIVVGPLWMLVWRGYIGWPGTLAGLVLMAAILTSAVTDFRNHRIYNWVTYSAFLWALVINITASILSTNETTPASMLTKAPVIGPDWLGGIGLAQCLAGAVLCFAFVLVAYHLSGGGAGDVKLATVIGALLGVHHGLFAVGYSYIVAAVAMTLWTIYSNGPVALAKAVILSIGNWIGMRLARFGIPWPFPPTEADTKLLFKPIPLGPFFAIGTLLVIFHVVPS
jgi:prepilin peptidase CpaA